LKAAFDKLINRYRFYRFRLEERRTGRRRQLPPLRVAARGAVEWLMAAQRATPDDGVAQMYDALQRGWGASYPETTGYIIPTLLDAAARKISDPDRLERAALRMGRWLLALQAPDGAFPFGSVQASMATPSVFNTGQILRGLTRLALAGVENHERFLDAARRAAAWMRSQQDADGAWRRGVSPLTGGAFHAYYVYAAAAMADFGKAFDAPEALAAAIANADFVLSLRDDSGWIRHMGFLEDQPPLLHTVAYTLQGLFDIGRVADRKDYLGAAEHAARRILQLQNPQTGALPGRLAKDFVADVPWSSMTGNSQMAVLWFHLAAYTGDPVFEQAARRANAFNRSIQDLHHPDEGRSGGLRGNYPTSPGYGCGQYFSWTQKFFLDALIMEMDRDTAASASGS
jgi:hypothetical protein